MDSEQHIQLYYSHKTNYTTELNIQLQLTTTHNLTTAEELSNYTNNN